MSDDKFIFHSIKDSKKISKVLANDTSRAILEVLAEKSMSASQLSEKMKLPLTTIDYSLKNLESVGLIKSKNGFNENKRAVKYYEPQEKFIVLSPGKNTNIVAALKSLLPVFGIVAVASTIIEYFVRIPVAPNMNSDIMPLYESSKAVADQVAQDVTYVNPHLGIAFFVASTLILAIIIMHKAGMLSFRKPQ